VVELKTQTTETHATYFRPRAAFFSVPAKIGHFSAPVSMGEADADNINDGKEKCIMCKGDICDTNNMASE
jgi:hypothetical protein